MTNRGKFIVIEGCDGSGKSTIHNAVIHHLMSIGKMPFAVRDPGGSVIGGEIRKILLNPEHKNMCATTELMLYTASRAQLVSECIKPHLDKGEIVVSDRYTLSTYVYQGLLKSSTDEMLKKMIALGIENAIPDLVILLDVSIDTAMKRLNRELDRMEQKGVDFLKQVRLRYLETVLTCFPSPIFGYKVTTVSTERNIDDVKKEVISVVVDEVYRS